MAKLGENVTCCTTSAAQRSSRMTQSDSKTRSTTHTLKSGTKPAHHGKIGYLNSRNPRSKDIGSLHCLIHITHFIIHLMCYLWGYIWEATGSLCIMWWWYFGISYGSRNMIVTISIWIHPCSVSQASTLVWPWCHRHCLKDWGGWLMLWLGC